MITALPTSSYPQLLDLITESEPIDSILSAGVDDNGIIFCLAMEGGIQISIKISDDDIAKKSFDEPTSQFAEALDESIDMVDEYVDRLTESDAFKPWLKDARELLFQSDSLNDYSDKLDSLYPNLPSTDFNELMKSALTATSMGGYYEAEDDESEFAMSDEEVEFKIAPGTIKEKNGKKYILIHSRWKSVDKLANQKKSKPKSDKPKEPPKPKYDTGFVGELPSELVNADPKRFQYKIIGAQTKTGEVGSLSGIKHYDPNLAGIVQVWKDPADNKLYIVNGHNRLALANRAGAEKITARIIDAPDAATARGIGALTNIAEGRGTPLDAAKFFRDSGLTAEDLTKRNLPIREKIATDGMAIAQLEPHLFDKVVTGDMTESRAALLGKTGLTGQHQIDLYELSKAKMKGGKLSDDAFSELAEAAKASQSTNENQGSLFDLLGSSNEISNALERASLTAHIKKTLAGDKKLFGLVSKAKAASDLSRAGNQIDTKQSGKMADEASSSLGIFDQIKNQKGGVGTVLSHYATEVAHGRMTQAQAHTEAYREISNHIKQEYLGNG